MSIEVQNITKFFGKQKALNEINFSIEPGEIVGFLGPNGAGKSTMMKILTSYIKQNEGAVKVNGYDNLTNALDVKSSVGYLPEHNPLYTELYIKEYLDFHADIHDLPKKRIEEVINMVGLTPEKEKKIGQLSKGYRQRVGLAAALIHDPDVLILDEPTTGLDPNQLAEIRSLIQQIGKEKTILLSTHIMQEVEAMCDRVIIINKGEIVADKKLKEFLENQDQIIEVEFDLPIKKELLMKIEYVNNIHNIFENSWELSFNAKEDMRSKVFDFAHENGLKTLQISQKDNNLERLFQNLTK